MKKVHILSIVMGIAVCIVGVVYYYTSKEAPNPQPNEVTVSSESKVVVPNPTQTFTFSSSSSEIFSSSESSSTQDDQIAGQFNHLKRGFTEDIAYELGTERFKRDDERNQKVIDKAFESIFAYLGSENNWNGKVFKREEDVVRVTSQDGILEYFIEDGILVNHTVSTLNRTKPYKEGAFGQGHQKERFTFPQLGDPYTYSIVSKENQTTTGDTVQTYKVVIEYTAENYNDIQRTTMKIAVTPDGYISSVDFIPNF